MAGRALDSKYNIQRPQADPHDVDILYELIREEFKNQKDWKEAWVTRSIVTRFLQANIAVEESFEVLKNFCRWRVEYRVDEIQEDDPEIIAEDTVGRCKFVGTKDVAGRPVAYIYPQYHNKFHGNYERLYKYIIYTLEKLCNLCDINEESEGKFCLVIDLDRFSLQNMDYQCVKKIISFLKNCYPERLGVCLIVNSPWIFYSCWTIIKCFLNDVTRSKFLFCGNAEYKDFIGSDMN